MTEAEWLNATDPQAMLAFLRDSGKLSERKARLFGVACCRLLPCGDDGPVQEAVAEVERQADGRENRAALKRARQAVRAVRHRLPAESPRQKQRWAVYWLAEVAASENAYGMVADEALRLAAEGVLDLKAAHRASMRTLLRDLFGLLPFHDDRLDPSWLSWNNGTVEKLARVAYEEREMPSGHLDRMRLAVLADALEEAGCDQPDLLDHLRGPGPHVRGCWALDLLLNKA